MGRFVERYQRHAERGAEHYVDQARSYLCSLMLGRKFGETTEAFIARSPMIAESVRECKEDIIALENIAVT